VIYVKSFLFGIGGAVAASVLWIVTAFVLPLWAPYVIAPLASSVPRATRKLRQRVFISLP